VAASLATLWLVVVKGRPALALGRHCGATAPVPGPVPAGAASAARPSVRLGAGTSSKLGGWVLWRRCQLLRLGDERMPHRRRRTCTSTSRQRLRCRHCAARQHHRYRDRLRPPGRPRRERPATARRTATTEEAPRRPCQSPPRPSPHKGEPPVPIAAPSSATLCPRPRSPLHDDTAMGNCDLGSVCSPGSGRERAARGRRASASDDPRHLGTSVSNTVGSGHTAYYDSASCAAARRQDLRAEWRWLPESRVARPSCPAPFTPGGRPLLPQRPALPPRRPTPVTGCRVNPQTFLTRPAQATLLG